MLPAIPAIITITRFISPFEARYPAGGITASLGKGKKEDSRNISETIPQYPRSPIVFTIHAIIDEIIIIYQQGTVSARSMAVLACLLISSRSLPSKHTVLPLSLLDEVITEAASHWDVN